MAEVSVRKRGTSWSYRFEIASIDGKRKQREKGGFKTKSEALKAGREALNLYEHGNQITESKDISVSDMFDKWLEEIRRTTVKNNTADGYEKKINLYIRPVIGGYKAKSITKQMLQTLIINLAEKGYSQNTVSGVRGILTSAFDWAEDNQMLVRSPAYRLKIPRSSKVRQRTDPHVYIEPEQLKVIFERFPEGHPSHLPMMIALHCGLRLGEVYGLVWEDIDLEHKKLSVNRQIQWSANKNRSQEDIEDKNGSKDSSGGYWYFSTAKYDSYRTIDLDDEITGLLNREFKRQKKAEAYYEEYFTRYYTAEPLILDVKGHGSDLEITPVTTEKTDHEINFVMRRENGTYITPRTMQHTSSIIHHKLDIPDFDFHSLRHTHATILNSNHANIVYIKDRLGHVNIDTTQNIYANHVTDELSKEGLDILNKVFNK